LTSALLLLQRPVHAQNSDFGFLLGVTFPQGEVASGPRSYVRGEVGLTGQFNYAFQAIQHAVDLYVELPLVIDARDAGLVTPGVVSGSTSVDLYFTPGVRLKFSPESRISLYGAFGGGLASFGEYEAVTTNRTVSLSSNRITTAALGFGGGLDFRLTRLLSFRIEGRDFVTRSGLGGSGGMHHTVVQLGIAFHF
jgi:hypothetical protein